MRYLLILVLLVSSFLILAASPQSASADSCQFTLGFKALHDQIPTIVGDCKSDERENAATGDSTQETTRGLLVWRKADNATVFTDGYRTWLLGPQGLQVRLNSDRFAWESGGANCQFVLGFKALRDRIPSTVGDCKENEHFNPINGDTLQQTTKGLLVWRKSDNLTVFTDGYRTWLVGPNGFQSRLNTARFPWEHDQLDLRVVSAGFGQSGNSIGFAAFIENPNSDFAVENAGLEFTAYDAAGKAVATQKGVVRLFLPTEKRAVASRMDVPAGTRVVLVLAKLESGKITAATRGVTFGATNGTYHGDAPTRISGTIANPFPRGLTNIYVAAVAYDAAGNVVGGGEATISSIAAGARVLVDVPVITSQTPARVVLYPSITVATRLME